VPDALFDRLVSFRIDPPGVALSFAQRLAHENGWSLAFAQRAIAEYFRFVWLAMRAGHPVTPSPAVDEVWHLHLCYTQSYWEDLCAKVLPRPLHHGPTRGGAGEDAKYADWYARTLASYREHFGEPPADLWPLPSERFRGGIPRKVDARSHWVVPKARVRSLLAVGARVAAVAAVLLLTVGCVDLSKPDSVMTLGITIVGGVFLFGIVMMVVFVRIAQRANRANPRRRADANSGCGGAGGCGFPVGGLGLHGHGHAHGHGSGLPPVLPVHDGHGHGVHGHGAHGHGGDHDHGHNGHGDGHGHGDGQGHGGDAGSSGGGDSGGGGGDSGGSSGCGGGGGGCGGGGD
jgi:hypothetical protein